MLLAVPLVFAHCGLREREQQLQQREAVLHQKEQELLLKEQALKLKEEELSHRAMEADRMQKDSFFVHPDILGTWSVQMRCTEAGCTGSAVGDIKNERWEFADQNNSVVAKAMEGSKLVRVYSGAYHLNTLELTAQPLDSAAQNDYRITVTLEPPQNGRMNGIRQIIREGNCKVVYDMDLVKQ